MISQNRRLFAILFSVPLLLLIPLLAMQFSNEVFWTTSDFAVAAILLLGLGMTAELVLRKVKKNIHRLLLCGAALFVWFLVWAELAVGVFGTPFAGS